LLKIQKIKEMLAVCNSCITNCDRGLEEAKLKPEYYTSNKARLCRAYLTKCDNFKKYFSEEEIKKILNLPVPEDKAKDDIIEVDDDDESIQNLAKRRRLSSASTMSSLISISSQQKPLTSFYRRQMLTNDVPRFEQLFVRMTISNGLPFSFVENEETRALFEFVAPGLVLPNRKAIGGRILNDAAKSLQDNIVKTSASDKDGVTAAFDG
jgi:hypothetical protein